MLENKFFLSRDLTYSGLCQVIRTEGTHFVRESLYRYYLFQVKNLRKDVELTEAIGVIRPGFRL